MESPRAGAPAVNCMITEGETIASVTPSLRHVECIVKATLKSVLLLLPLLVCFTPDIPPHIRSASKPAFVEHQRPRLWNVTLIALASRLWHRPLPLPPPPLLPPSLFLRGMLFVVVSEHPLGSPLHIVASLTFAEYSLNPMRLLQPL
jgi:hypothetical protein